MIYIKSSADEDQAIQPRAIVLHALNFKCSCSFALSCFLSPSSINLLIKDLIIIIIILPKLQYNINARYIPMLNSVIFNIIKITVIVTCYIINIT